MTHSFCHFSFGETGMRYKKKTTGYYYWTLYNI
jgi:hypothetical protein